MRYSKQPLDFTDILKLLKSRGLIIRDESKAIECLKVISYFIRKLIYYEVLNISTFSLLFNF